jgi:hypothetical protein
MESARPVSESILFITITLGLAYIVFWGPLVVLGIPAISFVGGERGPTWAIVLYMLGGFVPSAVGLALAGAIGGKRGLVDLLRRVLLFRIGWRNYLGILLVVAVGTAGQILVNRLLGNHFNLLLFVTQLGSLVPLIIIGPLSEEFGWRGYLLDRLQSRLGALTSALIVGCVWGLWHLPLFFIPGTSQNVLAIPFVGFLVEVTAISVLMTLFQNRTGGSLVTAVYFHWVYTYAAQVTATGVTRSATYNWMEYLPYVVAAVVVIVMFGGRLGRAERSAK